MKMTKVFAVALAALTIASCSKEDVGGSNNGIGGEETNAPTYATFKFNIGGASGRAVGDFDPTANPEQDAADGKIGRLQLLIFDATTQALEYNAVMAAKETSKTVLLTAGKKKIFFVANSDNLTAYNTAIDPATFAPGKTLTDFYALNFSAGVPQGKALDKTTTGRTFDLSPLHTLSNTAAGSEAGLPMSNTNEMTYTVVAGVTESAAKGGTATDAGTSATNTFKMQLYYMVAKARLVLAANVLNTTDAAKPIVKDVVYSVRNLARATNYIQNVPTAGSPQSFYYAMTYADKRAYDAEFDYASNITIPATEAAGNYLYVPENNHSVLTFGQASYFIIKATFEPVVITTVTYNAGTKVQYTTAALATADAVNRNYIYTTKEVQGIPAGTYFLSLSLFQEAAWTMKNGAQFTEDKRAEAEALVTVPTDVAPTVSGDFLSFKGGNSYYRVDIGAGIGIDTKYGVLRSNKYDATINKITGPGDPSEEDLTKDPTVPVSKKTYIYATIVPAVWNPITQSADL